MAQTKVKKYTFAKFLDYDAEDYRIELENGEIIIIPTATPQHTVFSFIMGYSSNIWQTNWQKKKD